MATFNTVEELLQILDRDPVLLQSLRARLLTKDLLELPQRFTTYAEATDQRLDSITQRLDDLAQRFSEYTAMADARFERIEKSIEALLEHARVTDRRLDNMDSNFKRLNDEFSRFRSNYAHSATIRSAVDIAQMLEEHRGTGIDETEVHVLSFRNLQAVARAYGTDRLRDIPSGDRRSFYKADMVLEVPDVQGDVFYVAVQASYACNGRDSRRAIRQAELLTMFTGKQAYPVVAGVRVDRRIQPLIDRGEVFWFEIEEERLEPDEAE